MEIDFPLAPLRRYLWDHLFEIIDTQGGIGTRSQDSISQCNRTAQGGSGVSHAWATGAGYEGFDSFRVELKKFSNGQSNPTFLLLVHVSPPATSHPPNYKQHMKRAQSERSSTRRDAERICPSTGRTAAAVDIHRFVLRKKPASVKVSSAHAIEREFRVLRALRQTDVPVPQALLLCENTAVIGTPFYIMEFVEGRVFADSALPGMNQSERSAAYASAAETLARLHRVDFVRVGLENYGRSEGGYLGRQVATLARVATKQAEDAGPIEGFAEMVDDLTKLSAADIPDRVALVHGDFRMDNLVFHPKEPRVIAILDWELSTLGHPLADLANLCILHHLPSASVDGARTPLAGLKDLDLAALGIPEQDELMNIYRRAVGQDRLSGVAGRGVAELGLAFIFFKMAVIAHGVKARLSRGVASSKSAAAVAAMVPMMIGLAKKQVSALKKAHSAQSHRHSASDTDGDDGEGNSNSGATDKGNDSNRKSGEFRDEQNNSARQLQPSPKAVLFDVGGVLSSSPLLAISQFEREALPHPLPPSYIGVAIAAAGEGGLFQRLERGEERLGNSFLQRFTLYLRSDEAKRAYTKHVERRTATCPAPSTTAIALEEAKAAVARVAHVDVLELFRRIAAAARIPVPEMIATAEVLRRSGLKVAAVSNDFLAEKGFVLGRPTYSNERAVEDSQDGVRRGDIGGGVYSRLPNLCDVVVLSSTSGCRKPGRRIYEDACEALGVSPSEAVFVDDIRANIRAAVELGMRTVWVRPGGIEEVRGAITELEKITGVDIASSKKDGGKGVPRLVAKL